MIHLSLRCDNCRIVSIQTILLIPYFRTIGFRRATIGLPYSNRIDQLEVADRLIDLSSKSSLQIVFLFHFDLGLDKLKVHFLLGHFLLLR